MIYRGLKFRPFVKHPGGLDVWDKRVLDRLAGREFSFTVETSFGTLVLNPENRIHLNNRVGAIRQINLLPNANCTIQVTYGDKKERYSLVNGQVFMIEKELEDELPVGLILTVVSIPKVTINYTVVYENYAPRAIQ